MNFDKMIHADELKLRILMTNTCSKKCEFCLNDFQPKNPKEFINTSFAINAIESYCEYFNKTKYPLQVYFSGGEPTLHQDLPELLMTAKKLGCRITLNTNGRDFKLLANNRENIDCLHIGVYEKSEYIGKMIQELNGDLQCVFSNTYAYVNEEFIKFYMKYNIPIKIFEDFYNTDVVLYNVFLDYITNKYPNYPFSFRFTGIQENRGRGCYKCLHRCITLRAAWIFPDNTTAPCPQLINSRKYVPIGTFDWNLYYDFVNWFHSV